MYLDHFGLNEPPFRITPHTGYFFGGAQREAILDALVFAVTHEEGIVRVTGEVGVGKTMLCRMLIERLPEQVKTIYLANPSLAPDELQQVILLELGEGAHDTPAPLRLIEQKLIALYAAQSRVVLIVDEAHAMPPASLELVRLLSNLESSTHKLLQIVLFGQPELDALLTRRDMRSLAERITHSFRLAPLDLRDTADYLRSRLHTAGYRGPDLFTGAPLRRLARASRGLTRRVNILADKSLMAAFADNTRTVTSRHVARAIEDAGYAKRDSTRPWRLAASAALAACMAATLWWNHARTPAGAPTPSAAPGSEKLPTSPVPSRESESGPAAETASPKV
ncbi:ExeA family protein [Uliginosibacterium sp. sgz301328]|uniref:ExeA family protein n=1 Tax=Uliginosibacterium sp. sgz301328 TaxID=3243764 RepID=UPI00359DD03C